MRKILFLCLLSFISLSVFTQNAIRKLVPGIHAVYGESTIIRNAPNQKAAIKHILPIGTKVLVIRNASEAEKINNIDDFWYKVTYDLDTGYIWGALISDIFLDGDFDGDSMQEVFLTYCNTFFGGTDYKYMEENSRFEFRMARNNKKISELKFSTPYSQYLCDTAELKRFRQFSPPITAICLTDSFAEANWGTRQIYLRFFDNKLDSLFILDKYAGEGGYVHKEKILIPEDTVKYNNTLIIETAGADFTAITPENPEPKWEYSRRYFKWDGKRFDLIKPEDKPK